MKQVDAIFVISVVAIATIPLSTAATVFYVDADDETNTARADGSTDPFFDVEVPNATNGVDGLWNKRLDQGNGPIYEANGAIGSGNPVGEDAPRLATTIGGLDAGQQYNLYAYFQANLANPDTDWRLRAGLENSVDDLPLFSRKGEDGAIAGTLITEENVPQGAEWFVGTENRGLFQATLGAAEADTNGEIHVYIDDYAFPTHESLPLHFFRTWYDGVGYEPLSSSTLAGDYNDDGLVDAGDYVLWRDSVGSTFDLAGNGDETGGSAGMVDDADYAHWYANYGSQSEGAAAVGTAIPEPGSFYFAVAALLSLIWIGRARTTIERMCEGKLNQNAFAVANDGF